MFAKKIALAAMAALTAATMVPTAAEARHDRGDGYGRHWDGDRHYRGEGRRYYRGDRYYRNRGHYADRGYYGGRGYYGYGRGNRCRDSGTTGTILGAVAGGLLGREVAGGRYDRGDRMAGTIIGAGVGALAGRAIDRDC